MSKEQEQANQRAFERGQDAWRDNKSLDANPYPERSQYHELWEQGWQAEAAVQEK